MTGSLRLVLGLVLCSGIVACSETSKAPMHDPVADKAAIDAVRNQVMSALNSGTADAAIAVYTDDAIVMPNRSHAPLVTGKAALRAYLEAGFSQVTMTTRITSSSVDISGDLAVDHYAGEQTVTFKPAPSR